MLRYAFAVCKWWWSIAIGVFVAGIQLYLYFQNANIIFLYVGIASLVLGILFAQLIVFRRKSKQYDILKKELVTAKQRDEVLEELGALRKEGVTLRNDGMKLEKEEEVNDWIKKVEDWRDNVINEIKKLSAPEAELFLILDWVRFPNFQMAINSEHDLHLRMLSMRTEMVLNLVQRFTVENFYKHFKFEE